MHIKNDEMFVGLFLLCLTLIFIPINLFLNAWAITLLWKWFVVPVTGLAALSYLQSMGLGLLVSFMTYQYFPKIKSDTAKGAIINVAEVTVVRAPLVVITGYVIKCFM